MELDPKFFIYDVFGQVVGIVKQKPIVWQAERCKDNGPSILAAIKCGRYQVAIEAVKVLLDTTPKPSEEYEDILHVYTKMLYLKEKHQERKPKRKVA